MGTMTRLLGGVTVLAITLAWPVPGPDLGPTTGSRPHNASCRVHAKLVPSCGVLWGAAPDAHSNTPRDEAVRNWETTTGRTATIVHTYHHGPDLFPTPTEVALTRPPHRPRILLVNWKVDEDSSWAAVAGGAQDQRIDALAQHAQYAFPAPFFLTLHHEPENDVDPTPGPGYTATDYAAMYRHVTLRLHTDGLTNAVSVMTYMGNEHWLAQPWWPDLYPGDDTVDWIALDSYLNAQPGGYHHGDFTDLIQRAPSTGGPGCYTWATTT